MYEVFSLRKIPQKNWHRLQRGSENTDALLAGLLLILIIMMTTMKTVEIHTQ